MSLNTWLGLYLPSISIASLAPYLPLISHYNLDLNYIHKILLSFLLFLPKYFASHESIFPSVCTPIIQAPMHPHPSGFEYNVRLVEGRRNKMHVILFHLSLGFVKRELQIGTLVWRDGHGGGACLAWAGPLEGWCASAPAVVGAALGLGVGGLAAGRRGVVMGVGWAV